MSLYPPNSDLSLRSVQLIWMPSIITIIPRYTRIIQAVGAVISAIGVVAAAFATEVSVEKHRVFCRTILADIHAAMAFGRDFRSVISLRSSNLLTLRHDPLRMVFGPTWSSGWYHVRWDRYRGNNFPLHSIWPHHSTWLQASDDLDRDHLWSLTAYRTHPHQAKNTTSKAKSCSW